MGQMQLALGLPVSESDSDAESNEDSEKEADRLALPSEVVIYVSRRALLAAIEGGVNLAPTQIRVGGATLSTTKSITKTTSTVMPSEIQRLYGNHADVFQAAGELTANESLTAANTNESPVVPSNQQADTFTTAAASEVAQGGSQGASNNSKFSGPPPEI